MLNGLWCFLFISAFHSPICTHILTPMCGCCHARCCWAILGAMRVQCLNQGHFNMHDSLSRDLKRQLCDDRLAAHSTDPQCKHSHYSHCGCMWVEQERQTSARRSNALEKSPETSFFRSKLNFFSRSAHRWQWGQIHSHSANQLGSCHFSESSEPPHPLTLQIDLVESSDLLVGSGGKDLNQDAVFCPGSLPGHKKRTALFKEKNRSKLWLLSHHLVARRELLVCCEDMPSLPALLHGSRTLQAAWWAPPGCPQNYRGCRLSRRPAGSTAAERYANKVHANAQRPHVTADAPVTCFHPLCTHDWGGDDDYFYIHPFLSLNKRS